MKFAIKLLILTTLVLSVLSLRTTKTNVKNSDDIQTIWKDLFSKPQGSNCKDQIANPLDSAQQNTPILDNNGVPWSGPRKKINILDKQQGFGPSAYFFDFIDEIFQADITKEFQTIYDEVKKLVPDEKEFTEPYPLFKLVGAYAPNDPSSAAKPTDPNDQTLINKLKAIVGTNNKVFNENSYKAGITVGNIYKACKDFQWNYNPQEVNFAKKIVDRYDFDGDGRLSPREFIIMSIVHNKNILGTTCKNCFNDIITKKIDPMFRFLDCNNDGKINAEDMWTNFENLNRKINKCNIYDCSIKGKKYRTNSMNDFIIKNMKSFDGYLTKEEFRAGILLGYWDRQVDVEKIYIDDTRTFKQLRWGASGDSDVVCQRILSANNPAPTPSATVPPASNPVPAPTPSAVKSYYFN
jgi:Ca2+-binding EF-hand superfamily protein